MTDSDHRRSVRSYVLRLSRLTSAQERALQDLWPNYGWDGQAVLDQSALFTRPAPLYLEIGFGNGDALLHMATTRPEHNFLGIEVHTPGVGALLQKAAAQGCENLRVSDRDALLMLRESLAPESLDGAYLFFPDPWHKKRHHKRRIVQKEFIDLVASRLKPGAIWHIATDWEDYAEWIIERFADHPAFEPARPLASRAQRPAERIETRFERRGLKLGHRVADLLYRRI